MAEGGYYLKRWGFGWAKVRMGLELGGLVLVLGLSLDKQNQGSVWLWQIKRTNCVNS